jgi:hypothetical protein
MPNVWPDDRLAHRGPRVHETPGRFRLPPERTRVRSGLGCLTGSFATASPTRGDQLLQACAVLAEAGDGRRRGDIQHVLMHTHSPRMADRAADARRRLAPGSRSTNGCRLPLLHPGGVMHAALERLTIRPVLPPERRRGSTERPVRGADG